MYIDPYGNVSNGASQKALNALSSRVDNCETNIQIILDRGTPVQGSFICGDWDEWKFITFAAWTA